MIILISLISFIPANPVNQSLCVIQWSIQLLSINDLRVTFD